MTSHMTEDVSNAFCAFLKSKVDPAAPVVRWKYVHEHTFPNFLEWYGPNSDRVPVDAETSYMASDMYDMILKHVIPNCYSVTDAVLDVADAGDSSKYGFMVTEDEKIVATASFAMDALLGHLLDQYKKVGFDETSENYFSSHYPKDYDSEPDSEAEEPDSEEPDSEAVAGGENGRGRR
jgi:hypothetical protein